MAGPLSTHDGSAAGTEICRENRSRDLPVNLIEFAFPTAALAELAAVMYR